MALTEEQIKANANIPTEEIEKDIADTQKEINQYEAELKVLRNDLRGNKVPIYMNEGRILKRQEFINNLKQIMDYRKSCVGSF